MLDFSAVIISIIMVIIMVLTTVRAMSLSLLSLMLLVLLAVVEAVVVLVLVEVCRRTASRIRRIGTATGTVTIRAAVMHRSAGAGPATKRCGPVLPYAGQ